MPFDTLKPARALRDKAGFSQEHAETAAAASSEVIVEQQDLKDLDAGLRAEITALRAEMRSEFAAVRSEMRTEFATVRAEIAAAGQRTIIRLGGMLVVLAGILLAAKFFR